MMEVMYLVRTYDEDGFLVESDTFLDKDTAIGWASFIKADSNNTTKVNKILIAEEV